MADSFGLKIGLEGEKEFKSAIADINRTFKVLGSEMKVVTSQFDKNDKSVGALTARNEVLNKEIEAQKEKIAVLNQALANASSSFGENDKRTQAWQIQLNNATAALNSMERELDENNKALDTAEDNFDDAAKEADDLGDEINQTESKFSKFSGTAKKVGAAVGASLAAIGAAAVAAGKKVWDMANDTAQAGDEIDKTSQKLGMSAEAYQEWDYVLGQSGVEITSMTTGLKTLTNQIDDAKNGSAQAEERFAKLGISMSDLNSMSREEVFDAVISGMQGMSDSTERAALANDLFGKSGQNLTPLFNQTAESTQGLKDAAHELGFVMSDEAVKASAGFQDSLDTLTRTFSGLKNNMMGELLPGFSSIMYGLSDLMVGSDTAGEKIKEGVSSVIESFTGMLPRILELLSVLLAAILENAPAIIGTLAEGILTALPSLAPVVLQVVSELINTLLSLLPQVLEVGLQIIVSLIQGIATALPTLIPQVIEIVIQLVQTLIENLPMVLDAAIQLVLGLVEGILAAIPILVEALPALITSIIDFILGAIPQLIEAGIQLFTSLIGALPDIIMAIVEAIPQIIEGLLNAIIENLPLIIESGIGLLMSLLDGIIEAVPELIGYIPVIIEKFLDAILNNLPLIIKMGLTMIVSLAKGLIQAIPQLIKKIPQIITSIVSALKNGVSKIAEVGLNFVKGLWNGISDAAGWVMDKIKGFGQSILNGIKSFFGIHSPSTVFKNQVGKNLALGVGEGFTSAMKGVTNDMEHAIPTEFDTNVMANVTSGVRGSIADTGVQGGAFAPIQNIIQFGDVTIASNFDIEYVAHKISDVITRDIMNKGGAFA